MTDFLRTMAGSVPVQTGVYARISQDRKGDTLGVRRQESACRKLADGRRWEVVDVYVDDDRSAYSGAPRPAYDRLLRDIEIGRIKALVVWHPDRLYRRLVELEAFVTLLERHPIEVGCVQAGDIDLSTANGRLQARVAAIFARHESEHRAERLQAKHQELAERGRWSGGPRPYGYLPSGDGSLEVIPAEAEIIREVVDRVLVGESVFSICRDLDARGVPTARGARWRPATLISLLRGPTIAGQRRWHGQAPTVAVWKPIIDAATSARLRAAVDPKRPRGITPRVNWLSGILVCGECARPLRGMRRENGKRRFACPPGPSHGGCGRIEVNAEPAEQHIFAMMCGVLDSQTLKGRKEQATRRSRRQALDSPEQLEHELEELAAMRGAGELSLREWQAARKPLLARIEAARADQARSDGTHVVSLYARRPGALQVAWIDLSLDQRHAIADAMLNKVTVNRATRRGPIFDPSRLDPDWRF